MSWSRHLLGTRRWNDLINGSSVSFQSVSLVECSALKRDTLDRQYMVAGVCRSPHGCITCLYLYFSHCLYLSRFLRDPFRSCHLSPLLTPQRLLVLSPSYLALAPSIAEKQRQRTG